MSKILEAKQIYKEFGQENKVTVLKGIDMEVEQGEYVVIMGQSGSGKSTLLYNISGMDKMTSGKVIFDGEDISALDDEKMSQLRLRKMGFIFQHSYLLKNMSLKDNIMLPAMKAKKCNKGEIREKVDTLMKDLHIDEVADHEINQVSGGQMQRTAIGRALINEPKILYGDEPTGALNASTTKEVMDILNSINQKGMTIVLVTHDAKVAARADRIIYLQDGEIVSSQHLGKYRKEEEKNREDMTSAWLQKLGF
ncbi:ABC transporter ATP-binding protein [Anaerosporobacter faecicola]|uniref:ABC transporter ATP-binding protein n=1 Tax=Anaerosporobacter faecicola TaxID=2718714 RepID=UPI001A9B621A|nr:ABC transporter ATP-binding protein [Anaerosporobacter faecicola]